MTHIKPRVGRVVTAEWADELNYTNTYTPALTALTTDPNLGASGIAEGAYHLSGDWVEGWARLEFSGTGLDPGSGSYRISFPIDPDPSWVELAGRGGEGTMLGIGWLYDSDTSANRQLANVMARLEDNGALMWLQADGTNSSVNASSPFTWASGDRIAISFAYKASLT